MIDPVEPEKVDVPGFLEFCQTNELSLTPMRKEEFKKIVDECSKYRRPVYYITKQLRDLLDKWRFG